MFAVNLYIETSIKGPYKDDGCYLYVLEYFLKDGRECTVSGRGWLEGTTRQRLELSAILKALKRMTEPSEIRIFTEYKGVLNPIEMGWLDKWERNGWINGKKEPVKNKDLWQQLDIVAKEHLILEENGFHSFQSLMKTEIKKMIQEKNGKENL